MNAGPGWPDVGPDGGTDGAPGTGSPWGTNIFSWNGVSGIIADRFLFLAGVYLTDAQPVSGNEPPTLNFGTIGTDFSDLSPVVNQSFFIGDGITSTGQVQQFLVPDGATRLYLGFMDSNNFGWPNGDVPYAYWDNSGTLTATFDVYSTPEPSTIVLLGMGAVALAGYAWRRRRKLHNLSPVILVGMVVLSAGSAQADVFNMPAGQTSMQFVTVGNPGNGPDPATGSLYGAVPYTYQIGKYDVTVGQYCQFLNAVAATDTYGLYNYVRTTLSWSAGQVIPGTPRQ